MQTLLRGFAVSASKAGFSDKVPDRETPRKPPFGHHTVYWRCNYCWICNQRGYLVETIGCIACSKFVCTPRYEMEALTRERMGRFLPWLSEISRHRRIKDLMSRAKNMRLLSRALAFAVVAAGAILPNALNAQVVPAIKGGGSQINVYGLYTLVKTDFNSTLDYPPQAPSPSNTFDANGWNQAFAGGADFRLGRFVFGQPAVGARYTWSTGTYGKQRTFVVGPELHYIYRRFRPYGDFLIGPGNITYRTGQTDNSIVYEFGGGVDYHKNHILNFRLVDFQYQLWDLGNHYYPPGFLPGQPGVYIDTKLKPYTLSFGVLIRVK